MRRTTPQHCRLTRPGYLGTRIDGLVRPGPNLTLVLLLSVLLAAGCETGKSGKTGKDTVADQSEPVDPPEEAREQAKGADTPARESDEPTSSDVDFSLPDRPVVTSPPDARFGAIEAQVTGWRCRVRYEHEGWFWTSRKPNADDCPWPEGKFYWDAPPQTQQEVVAIVHEALDEGGVERSNVRVAPTPDGPTQVPDEVGDRLVELLRPATRGSLSLPMPAGIEGIVMERTVPDERSVVFRVYPNGHLHVMESKWDEEANDFLVRNSIVVELSEKHGKAVTNALSNAHAALSDRVPDRPSKPDPKNEWSVALVGESSTLREVFAMPVAEAPPEWAVMLVRTVKEATWPSN